VISSTVRALAQVAVEVVTSPATELVGGSHASEVRQS